MHKGFNSVSLVRYAVTLLPLSLFLGLGGISGCKTRAYNSSPKLIGGRKVESGEFPGVLQIDRSCTASLIGKRHILTAGHCVLDDFPGKTGKAPVIIKTRGHKLLINAGLVQGVGETTALVESVAVHPSYLAFNSVKDNWDEVSDIAVITLQSDFSAVPPIPVDFSTIRAGEPIVLVGFGCQRDSRGGKDTDTGRIELKTGERKVIAVFEKTFTTLREDEDVEEKKKVVQLCPGDSGGPVLTLASGKPAVKGVNAYTQHDMITGFARLDAGAESWIRNLVPDLNGAHASGSKPPAPTAPTDTKKPTAPPTPQKPSGQNVLETENWDSIQRTRCSLLAEELGITQGSWPSDARCYVRLRPTAVSAVLELVDEGTKQTLGTSVEGVPTSGNVSFSFAGGGEWKVSAFGGELRSVVGSSYVFMFKRSQ